MTDVLRRRVWWIIAFAILWPVIGGLTAGFITSTSVDEADFIFSSMEVLRRFILPGVVSGFFLAWLVFTFPDRAQSIAAPILIVLSCLFRSTLYNRVTPPSPLVHICSY